MLNLNLPPFCPGKAVFSEKPIGETPADTRECYEMADKMGKPLFCGFQRRWDPTFSNIQANVRNGTKISSPFTVNVNSSKV